MSKFQGWLLKFGDNVLPMKYISLGGWDSTPNQRVEIDAYRDANSLLHRDTADGTKTSLKITILPLLLSEKVELDKIIGFATLSGEDKKQRRVIITYWNDETMDYQTGTFYIADINYKIKRVLKNGDAEYESFSIEMIEY